MAKNRNDVGKQAFDSAVESEGFQRVNAQDGQPIWFLVKPGAILRGELIGHFARKGRDGHYFQVLITRDTGAVGVRGKDEEREEHPLRPGMMVNLDRRSALDDLVAVADDLGGGSRYEIIVTIGQRIPLPGGKTFWPMDIGKRSMAKTEKRPDLVALPPMARDSDDSEGGDDSFNAPEISTSKPRRGRTAR